MRSLLITLALITTLVGCASIPNKPGSDVSQATIDNYNLYFLKYQQALVKAGDTKKMAVSEPLVITKVILPSFFTWPVHTVNAEADMFINKNGSVVGGVMHKTNDPSYNLQIIAALMQWKFEPPKLLENKNEVVVRVPFRFPSESDSQRDKKDNEAKGNQVRSQRTYSDKAEP